jgi:DNA-binding protein HU-beta
MNRKELAAALADKTGSTKTGADRNVIALIGIISDTMKKGDKISLSGFGIFEVRERAARAGRNPRTGEPLEIKATRVPAFKAGVTLKAALNGSGK